MHSRREPGFKSHFILSEGDTTSIFLSVESLAISHYQKTEGWSHAVHAEGATFSTLYGVLFWNVVFGVEVPDVFRNAFQVSIVICFAYFTHTHASTHTLPSFRCFSLETCSPQRLTPYIISSWHGTLSNQLEAL